MKSVYRIRHDSENYQYFLPEDENDWEKLKMKCVSMKSNWIPPAVFIYEPFLKQGDFYNFRGGLIISNSKALNLLSGWFEERGEVLPLPYKSEIFSIINILHCIDCLDHDKTIWKPNLTVKLPRKYAFNPSRLPEPGLFKIPETYTTEILVFIDALNYINERNFKYGVESNGLEGLIFEKIWTEEN